MSSQLKHVADSDSFTEESPLIGYDSEDAHDSHFASSTFQNGHGRTSSSAYGRGDGGESGLMESPSASRHAMDYVYFGVLLIGSIKSLEEQTTFNFLPIATSSFNAHALIATVSVVQSVTLAVIKPPISKVADVFGRLEAFILSILFYVLGYSMQAASGDAAAFIVATAFYATGQTGVQILSQIVIADISDLLDRTILSSFLDVPFMLSVWLGPWIAEFVLDKLTWRWGYGIWAVLVPIAFIPLASSLFVHRKGMALARKRPAWRTLSRRLDLVGLTLLGGAITFILIPLTLHAHAFEASSKGLTFMLILIGVACLIGLVAYEMSSYVGPNPIVPRHLFRSRTVVAGLALAFFYFMAFYTSVLPYFYSYLLVVHNQSVASAGHITQMFTFSCTIIAVLVSFAIKKTRRYRRILLCGCLCYTAALILMALLTPNSSTFLLVVSQLLLGTGGGLIHGPAQLGVQAAVSHGDVATVTALFLTFLEVGGAAGSAIAGSIWSSNLLPKLEAYLPPETVEQAAAIYGDVNLASTKWSMDDPTRIAINRAYQETIRMIFYLAILASLTLLPLGVVMKNYALDEVERERERALREQASHEEPPYGRLDVAGEEEACSERSSTSTARAG